MMMASASVNEEKDEMDSLFEGMVLFNPCQTVDENDDDGIDHVRVDHGQDQHQQQQQQQPQPQLIEDPQQYPARSIDPNHHRPPQGQNDTSSAMVAAAQPLDENLFSDLTLITPIQDEPSLCSESQHDNSPIPPTTTTTGRDVLSSSTVLRQLSTRKKKRAGLRIGYGRDAPSSDDPPSPPHRPASSEIELGGSADQQEEASLATPSPATDMSPAPTAEGGLSDEPSKPVDSILSRLNNDALPDEVRSGLGDPIELRFEQLRAQVSEKLSRVREQVASVSAARKESAKRRRKAADKVNLALIRYRELEKKLDEACEAEDFETAERVSESLASAEKDRESLSAALGDAEVQCDAIDAKMQKALEWQIQVEEECASLLKKFVTDAANDADEVLKSGKFVSTSKMDKWLLSIEDLEVKKMELEIESEIVNAARLVLNDSIEHSVEDDKRERELLHKRKEVLTKDLEKLLALVKAKKAEIAENDHNIETVEKRIADVHSSFHDMQASLTTKYNNLQSGISQVEAENEVLSRSKKEINDFLSQEEDRGAKLQKLAQISRDEATSYQEVVELRKRLMLLILKSSEDKVRLAKTEEKLTMDVQMLRQEVLAARASLQELSSTKSSLQQEIESVKLRLIFIEKRVPELEAEKKVAAAARNFKEAARIANESRTLNVDKEGLQVKMEEAELKLGKLEEDICNNIDRLQETESHIASKEKEMALTRFQRLLLIAGAAKAERSAALGFGDIEEADVLLGEAEAAESEARKLQKVHNFKEEEYIELPKKYISMELVSSLGEEQLTELAASAHVST